ncbi:ACP S-malonyltransferase [Psychrobium sp. 1_MG-2023]|uniref:ACP S-malonyltransferase n=1 Tax=Psychrobium sp. 1_MG-2023 TaxID=3062624 RepID=UPI000C330129|nr:ACP S-malonyltransferase [Psychrobium sp. 1_MG-2023]MDP2562318.1 ACP S-malonyltransferase [Psychrobium sp. 1_MG-2023]PKF58072.1 [acyl-carrier-protein] S-malonyltransferase [Alteromonadales bacterium alter-6D02]
MSQTAIVFPGQGSQALGMLSDIAEQHSVVEETFAQASKVLGYDLWALVQNGPADDLNRTDRTQPALLAASVAIWRVWQEQGGVAPAYLAGHSLGEYSALVCAGAIAFEDAIKLVELRGQYMLEAVPQGVGSMAAIIGLADDAIATACEQAAQDQVVSPVNFNSPGQVVIAGHKDAVDRASALCKEAGAKRALPLAVSVPSHCSLMTPAAEKLKQQLESIEINTPVIPVINNVDVAIETDSAQIKDALVRQLFSPVRWTETVQFLAANDVTTQIEVGPGKVLSGLAKRIDKAVSGVATTDAASLEKALA